MAGPDSYYTPSPLADKLVEFVNAEQVFSAIDFCVGDGNLLKAIAKRYKRAKLFGTDISVEALTKLSSNCSDWELCVCDFRDDESINNVRFLQNRTFDLIMLNPPFTCKGSIVEHLEFNGEEFRLSTAMFFLMRALRYLSEDGGLYAILPISCVYSEKDRIAWEYLKKNYNACVLDEPNRVYFSKKCSPNIVFVYAGRYPMQKVEVSGQADFSILPVIEIVRGCTRMQNPAYSKKKVAIPLIHTTNIQKGKLVNLKRVIPGIQLTVDGYGVVIPRVCNPNQNKIALLDGAHTYALSDCVIVLRTANQKDAEQIRNHILDNWSDFISIYKGTGAQYVTLERVRRLFGKQQR